MIPDIPLRTANHAEQLMAIEVFSELLAATDPRELGQRLTEQLRELTGARTVALLAHPAAGAAHALIHVCPARRAPLFGEAELGLFCSHCSPAPLPNLTAQLAPAHPLRDVLLRAGIETLVRIPLRVRDEVVSTLVLLDLPEPGRIAEAVTIVTRLAPVIALALKNAFAQARIAEQAAALQSQTAELECRVAERTAALEEANRSLAASRLAALNLMEDAVAARRRAEETSAALQHSEALFRRTFDEAPIGAAIVAPDGIFRRVNTALCTFLGYTDTELIGRHFADITHPDDRERSGALAHRLLRGEISSFEQEKRYVRKDGVIVWGRVSAALIRDTSGRPIHLAPLIRDITAHKMAEEALRRSEQRYATTLAAVNDGLWEWNVVDGTAYLSPLYYSMLGYADGAFPATYADWRALIHPEDLERVEGDLRRSIASGVGFNVDLRMKAPSGEWRWVCTRGNTIERDAQGQAQRMVGTLSDITPRKQAEHDLERFFSLVPDMVCIASDDGRFLKLNDAWSHVLGYTKEELMAVPYNTFIHPEDLAATSQASVAQRAGHPSTNFVNRYRAKDGTYRWLEWNATPLTPGEILFAAARDITEHRLAEEAVRESEVRYRTLADSGQALIWTSGLDMKCNYFNQPWLDFTGRPLEQELGDGWTEGVHPEDFDRCVATYIAAFARREKFSMDYRIRHRSGEYRWIQDNGSPRFDSHGEFLGYIGHCLDITERKLAEQALRESEERLRITLETTQIGVWDWDVSNDRWTASPTYYSMLGYPPETGPGDRAAWIERVHPSDRPMVASRIASVLDGSIHSYDYEARMRHADGSYRWQLVRGDVVARDPAGRPSRLVGTRMDISLRRTAEEELRQKTALLEAQLDSTLDGILVVDDQGKKLLQNRRLEELWQIPPDIADNPDDRVQVRHVMEKTRDPEIFAAKVAHLYSHPQETSRDELELVNGTVFDRYSAPVLGRDGQYYGRIWIFRDITDRKRADQALRESEEKFAKIFHAAPAWIGITDMETATYLDINDEALRLSGFAREEVLGRTSADFGWITAAERARLAQQVQEHGRTSGIEMTFHDRAGRSHIGWLSSERIGIQGRPCLLTIIVDITERKNAEDERRRSHELLAKLTAQVPGVVYQYQLFPDGRSCFPYSSPGMRTIYEFAPEEVREDATPVFGRLHPEDVAFVSAAIFESARTLAPFHCEFRVILPRQGLRWRLSDAMPERLPDGGTLWYGIISDITERRRAEEALHASLREKEALLKEVHHRVKNNLQIISSLLRLQAGQIEHPATVEVLQDMQGRIRSMALLHETLYRSGNLAQVDLADYLESICTQLLRATNRRGTGAIAFDFALAPILLDATQAVPCGLLVNELAANCLKHAFPGGRPGTVHVRLQLVTAATPPLVELSVADDGIGLPPDFDLAALHSLGLQLVSDLAQQLRGTLAITPGPETGAVFTVSFPCPSAPR